MNKAIFFDRDGIVNRRIVDFYIKSPLDFEFLPEFLALLQLAKSLGYLAIVITNQQGIGKGLTTEEEITALHSFMQTELLAKTGLQFDDVFSCGDLANSASLRRKPAPGMLFEAKEKWDIDLAASWMIGDRVSDAQAGKSAGTKTILVGDYASKNIPSADKIYFSLAEVLVEFSELLEKQ